MQIDLGPVMKVAECVEMLNTHLGRLGEFVVEGEISRFDIKNGRLIFGALKDEQSAIDIFSMGHIIRNFRQFEPGMLVQVYATAGLYKTSGKFRLFVNQIIPQGEGALQIAYEKLKAQLQAEGLFALERKRPLPLWPKRIGLITATGSSAQADLIKILSARMGGLRIITLPVNVQGRGAVPTIMKAFRFIRQHPLDFDVIIMARGGGSLEDLAVFNSEEICREVFACQVPVISAVGHEDNWSLTDFVADLRASTPSNAAELAVKDKEAVLAQVIMQGKMMHNRLQGQVSGKQAQIESAVAVIRRRVKSMTQTVNLTIQKVPAIAISLQQLTAGYKNQLVTVLPKMKVQLQSLMRLKAEKLAGLERLILSLDYRSVLKRGYSITFKGNAVVCREKQVKSGDMITSQLAEGTITSVIN